MLTGRETETSYLNNYYDRVGSQIFVVYGQKGIGKTSLLRSFVKKKPHLYFEAISCSYRQQLYYFGRQLRDMGIPASEYPDFREIIEVLTGDKQRKQVLVIDEFQHLCKNDGGFQEFFSDYWKQEDKGNGLFLVLASSSIGWVENSMLDKMGDLGRHLTGFLKLRELKYRDFVRQFPGFDSKEGLLAYSILGGNPQLWQHFNDDYTIKDNVCNFILPDTEKLFTYGQQIVQEELRETAVYNTILSSLADGMNKLNDLHRHTGFSRAKISVYLKNLIQLEIVEKVHSMETTAKENVQKGLYRISHAFVRFYYRYLFPNQTVAVRMEAEDFYDIYIDPTFEEFASDGFALICREYLERENALGRLPVQYKRLETWEGKVGTIDFIGQDAKGNTLTGFCSRGGAPMSYEDYEWYLFCQEKAYLKVSHMILFSVNGFDRRLEGTADVNPGITLLTLEQL
ncbi:MAG: ATP-binding protein [Lachnospiraceae bacterium]|nr:ATP-binding protein [Lachnospiraceae bacterium]